MFIAGMAGVIFSGFFFRRSSIDYLDAVAETLGVVLILLGQLVRVSARGYKSEHSQEGGVLIRGGPYALVRNPMYLGILLIGLGIVLVLFNWWGLAVFLLVFILRYILLIFKEENKLRNAFPKEYSDYLKKTPRILPAISGLLKKDPAEYLPLKLVWLKKEIGSILIVFFGTLLIESWEDIIKKGIGGYAKEAITILTVVLLFVFLAGYLIKRTSERERNGSSKS